MASRRIPRNRAGGVRPAWTPPPNHAASVYYANVNNLSAAEKERLIYLSGSDFGALFDAQMKLEEFDGADGYVDEAKGAAAVPEDFLEEHLRDLERLASESRGERKERLTRIIEAIREQRDDAVKNGEHVVEQLELLGKELTKLRN